jgi:hypothetical protein
MNLALTLLPSLFLQQLNVPSRFGRSTPIEASALWIHFGQVEVGDSNSESIALINSLNRPVEILDIDTSGDDPFQVDDSDCAGITLNSGDSCQIEIQFEPEEVGNFSGEVKIETDHGQVEIQMDGEGVYDSI